MSKVNKSFATLGLADGILDGVVGCIIEAEKKAKSSREIQTVEVSRRGLRQDIYVGRVMVVPHQIMDDTAKIPDPLLKGAVLKLFDGEDAVALEMHRLSSSEFDDLDAKTITEYKDKVFRDDTNKLGCVVLFLPAWGNVRDYHAFRFTKDEAKLKTLVRHLVFSAYYNPSLSALFETLDEQGIKLDAENITHQHVGLAFQLQSEEKSFPVLDKGDSDEPLVEHDWGTKKGGIKKGSLNVKRKDKTAEEAIDASVMKLSVSEEFVNGYLEAAVWSGTDEDGQALDSTHSVSDFSEEARMKAEEDCEAFYEMAGDKLAPMGDKRSGVLFWLNRNGHGSGFWDEETLDQAAQEELDELSHGFGECDLYVGDDGKLELSGGHIPPPPVADGSGHVLPVQGSQKVRFASWNIEAVKAATETAEEQAVLAELEAQLRKKLGSDPNFKEGVTAGDAGSVRIPTDPNSGVRNLETDTEKIAADPGSTGLRMRPDYGEAESFTSEANEVNAAGGDDHPNTPDYGGDDSYSSMANRHNSKGARFTAALLSKIADDSIHNGYAEMRNLFCPAPECPDTHKAMRLRDEMDGMMSKIASDFYFWGYMDHNVKQARPFTETHAEEAGTVLGPRGLASTAAYKLMDKWNRLANAPAGDERYTILVHPPEGFDPEKALTPYQRRLRDRGKEAADPSISSTANRLVEQHYGEYFTTDSLKALLRNATDNVKAVFSFMTQEGLLVPYGDGQYKIQTRQHGEAAKLGMWGEEEDENDFCPNCMGPGTELGVLGNRKHFRCRDCGMDYSRKLEEKTASEWRPPTEEEVDTNQYDYELDRFGGATLYDPAGNTVYLQGEDADPIRELDEYLGTEEGADQRREVVGDIVSEYFPAENYKRASRQKQALTYMHPGQVLEQFYPEVLKDVSNYPQGYAERNYTPPPLQSQPGMEGSPTGDTAQVTLEDYSDNGIMHSKGQPGLIPTQDNKSVPLKPNERSIRGPFFSDQFYRIHTDISPALLTMKSSLENKTAASPENAKIIAEFLRKLAGEIASSLLAAFVVTGRPLFTRTPAYSTINISTEGDYVPINPILTSSGLAPYATQLRALLKSVNDGELSDAINDAWAQSAVWHNGDASDRYLYEVFVRIEKVDTDTLEIAYKYVTGIKE